MNSPLADKIEEVIASLPPHEQAQLRAKLVRVITHRKALHRFPTPGHLSKFHRPEFMQTPMLDRLDQALMMAERGDAQRIIVNTPPQEGKTSRLQDACAWMLLRDPRRRIVFASYEQSIAAQSSLEIRRLIEAHGGGYRGQAQHLDHEDVLGLLLDPDRAQQTNWSLADVPGRKTARPGSVTAVGVGSSLSGRPADIIVIDDPIKDSKQADSPTWRKAVTDWYQSVVIARLPPKSVIVVVQTRWHEDDLTGWLLKEESKSSVKEWLHINVPAQADSEDDILDRKVGEYMISARGRTPADWEKRRREVGTRWWFAMYQGAPSAPEGGTFKREWFDKYRVAEAPPLRNVITLVDPADNTGAGDEAGVVTGGLGANGEMYILEDNSGSYTVAEWVRVALYAMLRHGSGKLVYEQSLSGLRRSIKAEWKRIRVQARELARAQKEWSSFDAKDWPEDPHAVAIRDAHDVLADEDDTAAEKTALLAALIALWPYVPAILRLPETGPPVKTIQARGSKSLRAELVSPHFEGGRVHHVGTLAQMEHQMCTWLPSQDSPDRMDAEVHLVDELAKAATAASVQRPPAGNRLPAKAQPLPQIMRSTRYMR
jgi:hypothetical protein